MAIPLELDRTAMNDVIAFARKRNIPLERAASILVTLGANVDLGLTLALNFGLLPSAEPEQQDSVNNQSTARA